MRRSDLLEGLRLLKLADVVWELPAHSRVPASMSKASKLLERERVNNSTRDPDPGLAPGGDRKKERTT